MVTNRQITDSYHELSGKLIQSAAALAVNSFKNLGSWRDEDADKYIDFIARNMMGIKRQASNLALGYYREIAKNSGETFRAVNITQEELTTAALRNGVDTATVYRRPFVDLYMALKAGKDMKDAIEAGAWRARSLATTEVQLARRGTGLTARKNNDRIVGYIRTLSGAENCALCYIASTQRYRRGDLMPIHPGCDCGELPIYGDQDPGQIINEDLLEATHEAIGDRFGLTDRGARDIGIGKTFTRKDGTIVRADLTAIEIQDNGELGPVLTVKGQNFTGPEDLP